MSRSPGNATILLVDDEPGVRSVLARALRREGYHIVDAGDGAEALGLMADDAGPCVHLLITDLDMPRLGGADLAEHLLAARRVERVIFMTGSAVSATLGGGAHSVVLLKPFRLQELAIAVREMLGR